MNPQEQQKLNNSILTQLSSNQGYFLVYPFSKRDPLFLQKQKNKKLKNVPIVLVYSNDDNLTIDYLVNKFLVQNKLPNLKELQGVQLEHNYVLKKDQTIADLKGILRNDDINGLQLYPYVYNELDSNQCSFVQCIQSESFFNKGDIELECKLQPVGYTFYVKISLESKIQTIQKLMIQEIQRIFGKKIKPQNFNIQVYFEENWNFLTDKLISQLKKSNKFRVKTKGIDLSPPIQNKCQIIIKGSQIQTTPLQYDIKKQTKVGHLLQELFPKQKKNYWDTYGLLVDSVIIKNHQKLQKIRHLFAKSTLSNKHFVAHLIKEQHIFELEQQKIKNLANINPNYLQSVIVNDQVNLEHRKKCEKQLKNRADSATHVQFKGKIKQIQPILWYTSQLRVKSSQQKKQKKISSLYDSLNTFLRTQNFAKVSQDEYEKWEYIFESELVQKLKKLPSVTDKQLWRGVSYRPQYKVGQKVLFKQFLSTSTNVKKAFEFGNKAIFKVKKSSSGSSIEDYTYFKTEDQVLFPPYTEFIVTKVNTMLNTVYNKDIACFEIEQLPKQPLPTNKIRFILWVDDKTMQGKEIWDDFKLIEDTTMMVQLIKTQQLRAWLLKNQHLVKDQSVEIVMITNMTRQQDGVKKEEAGIDSIKIFRQYLPNNNIFVYIGWVQGTLQKLKKHKYAPSQILHVSNDTQELRDFLKKKANIK